MEAEVVIFEERSDKFKAMDLEGNPEATEA
jgi:hypothetical protein